jgi:hypothetical protein
MPARLVKIAAMASSSKRRASSSKPSSAGKVRVISVGRTDALPRKGNTSAARRKPVVQDAIDAHSLQQTKTPARRAKTTRSAGRASGKPNEPAATEIVESLPIVETEVVVEASAIVEETTIVEVPSPLPVHEKPALVTIASRLLSTLFRWTGLRQ